MKLKLFYPFRSQDATCQIVGLGILREEVIIWLRVLINVLLINLQSMLLLPQILWPIDGILFGA